MIPSGLCRLGVALPSTLAIALASGCAFMIKPPPPAPAPAHEVPIELEEGVCREDASQKEPCGAPAITKLPVAPKETAPELEELEGEDDAAEAESHELATPGDETTSYTGELDDEELARLFVEELEALGTISVGFGG